MIWENLLSKRFVINASSGCFAVFKQIDTAFYEHWLNQIQDFLDKNLLWIWINKAYGPKYEAKHVIVHIDSPIIFIIIMIVRTYRASDTCLAWHSRVPALGICLFAMSHLHNEC